MIALQKDTTKYDLWLNQNKAELYKHFEQYRLKNKKDWITQKNREKIQEFLFPTSYGKCAYCERIPNNGGGNIEIEHIIAKTKDNNLVFSLENLLPSCKHCNTVKGIKDSSEILNPYIESSFNEHLELEIATMRISGLSENGKKTIEILNLSLNAKDFRLDKKYFKGAVNCRIKIKDFIDKTLNTKKKHKENQTTECLVDELIGLIELIDKERESTSTYATYLLNNEIFKELVDFIKLKDKNKFEEIDLLVKEKSKYCISIK